MKLIVSFEFVLNEDGKAKSIYRGMESDIHVHSMDAEDIEREVRDVLGTGILGGGSSGEGALRRIERGMGVGKKGKSSLLEIDARSMFPMSSGDNLEFVILNIIKVKD